MTNDPRQAARELVDEMAFNLLGRKQKILSPEEFPAGTPAYLVALEVTLLLKADGRFGTIIIDRQNPGTHATYNVLFNSACRATWWPDEQTAVSESFAIAEERFLADKTSP